MAPPITSDVDPDPAEPTRPGRWPVWLRALLAVGTLALVAVLAILGARLLDRRDFNAVTLGGPVNRIDVQVADGDVELVPGSGDDVVVERSSSWRFRRPDAEAYVDDGTARIRSGCPPIVLVVGSCSVTHRIEVPAGVRVDVRTYSGRVTLGGVTGWVRVVTTEGRVEGDGILSPEVLVDTSGGSVGLAFAGAPSRVAVVSGGSGVDLRLPGGPYELDVRPGDGDVDIDVETDDLAERVIEVDTDGGDVSIRGPGSLSGDD